MQAIKEKLEWERLWLQVRALDNKTTAMLFAQVFGHLEVLNDKVYFEAVETSLKSIKARGSN